MKNNIANLKTCLFCAKNYKEQKDIRWEEFVETMHEIEKIFIKYFQNESRKYAEEVENHFLDFTAIDKTTKIHKLSFEDFMENLKNLLAKAHFLWQKFLSKMLGKNFDGFYLENAEAVEYANNHAWELISGIDETTKKTIQSILANAFASGWSKTETISAIQKEFEEFGKVRASLIAQMETVLAHEHGEAVRFAKFAEEAGVKGWKRSKTQGDEKTRRSHLVNEIDGWIENDKLFSGTSTLHAPHGFRCRCVTIRRLFEPSEEEREGVLPKNQLLQDYYTINKEKIDFILQNNTNVTKWEATSIVFYTGWWFAEINKYHRAGIRMDETSLISLYLDKFLQKTNTYKWVSYRWVYWDFAKKIENMKIGETFTDVWYMSTTLHFATTHQFWETKMKIIWKNGKNVILYAQIDEDEILFARNSTFEFLWTEEEFWHTIYIFKEL